MVVSVADASYVTIAKGPLTTPNTFPDLGFPCHMLLMPQGHLPALHSVEDRGQREKTTAELNNYCFAIQKMIQLHAVDDDGKPKLGVVTWAIERAKGVHLNWQLLPVPIHMIDNGIIDAAFNIEAENLHYPRFVTKESDVVDAEQSDHFKVVIWTDEQQQRDMVLPLDNSFRFNLQFGRRVLAKLLGLESRLDWRAIQQPEAEEEEDAERFKALYQRYDFLDE